MARGTLRYRWRTLRSPTAPKIVQHLTINRGLPGPDVIRLPLFPSLVGMLLAPRIAPDFEAYVQNQSTGLKLRDLLFRPVEEGPLQFCKGTVPPDAGVVRPGGGGLFVGQGLGHGLDAGPLSLASFPSSQWPSHRETGAQGLVLGAESPLMGSGRTAGLLALFLIGLFMARLRSRNLLGRVFHL